MSRLIHILPAPTGSGKTYCVIEKSAALAKCGDKVLLVLPTRRLIREVYDTLRRMELPAPVTCIYKNEDADPSLSVPSVQKKLKTYFDDSYPDGQILIITWKTFEGCAFFPNKNEWQTFVDEVPNVLNVSQVNIPQSHALLTDNIVVEPKGSLYGLVKAKPGARLHSIADNEKDDDVFAVVRDFAQKVVSNRHNCYVRLSDYELLKSGRFEREYLTMWSLLDPSIFSGYCSVTIAAAKIEDSLLYKWWDRIGVDFSVNTELQSKLLYHTHENGRLITFIHGTNVTWSKHERNKDADALRLKMAGVIRTMLAGERFLWLENKDRMNSPECPPELLSPFAEFPGNQVLPHSPHGLNDYKEFDHVVMLAAHRYTPETSAFLSRFCGIDKDEQLVAFYYQTAYQVICRGSIRDRGSNNPKMIFVADRGLAEWLQVQFPGSNIQSMGLVSVTTRPVGRVRIHANNAAKTKAHRDQRQQQLLADIEHQAVVLSKMELAVCSDECNENTKEIIGNNVTRMKGTLLVDKYAKTGIPLVYSDADFISYLKIRSKMTFINKEDNALISPAVFDPNQVEKGYRTLEHVVTANGLWFDVEGGSLPYQKWAEIFPHLQMVIYNTHSHTRYQPRYRVFIPTDSIMSKEAYQILSRMVKSDIVNEGYELEKIDPERLHIKAHGIDNKHNPSDLFYLPCKAKLAKESFFKIVQGPDRKPLDVKGWLEHATDASLLEIGKRRVYDNVRSGETQELTHLQKEVFAQSENEFMNTGTQPGQGDEAIFKYFLKLTKAGIRGNVREGALRTAANLCHTPRDRHNRIDRLLKGS